MDWIRDALDRLWLRVDETAALAGERYPLYADAGGWTTTGRGSWAGGFWAGLLALRAAVGSPAAFEAAVSARDRLAPWADQDTVCRGMIFWYGETLGLLGLAEPAPSTGRAARALAERFDPAIDAVPWGTRFAPEHPPVRPDGAAGAAALLAWSGHEDLAGRHLRTHLRHPAVHSARDQAWLLLAAAEGVRWLGHDYLGDAARLAEPWSDGRVPRAVAGEAWPDTSAAAIAAVALLELACADERWREPGVRLLAEVIRVGQLGHGGIGHGCYDPVRGLATDHELVWGDYFAALGLARAAGLITGGP
jgi:unsaturated chondroitin disaccharide hydrolase